MALMSAWPPGKMRRTLGTGMFASEVAARTYAQILVEDYGADEVWPLVDIASGTTIHAHVNSNRDGTLAGWDLQNAAGPVTDALAPYSDGANDYGDVDTSNGTDGIRDIADCAVFSIFAWAKVDAVGVWTDSTFRRLWLTRANTSNLISLYKRNNASGDGDGDIVFQYLAGAVDKRVTYSTSNPTGWFSIGLSVDVSAGATGELKAFLNGVQVGSTQTDLGTWSGTPDEWLIGADNTTPQLVWDGLLAYSTIRFGSTWTPTQISEMHDAAATAGAD